VLDESGDFDLEIDCGSCTPESPTSFDIVARPPAGSRFPWAVIRDVPISGDTEVGTIKLGVPRRLGGQLTFEVPGK
jgi:hypothetical protein